MKSLAIVSLFAVLAIGPAAHAAESESELQHTLVLTVESPAEDQRLDRILRAVSAVKRVEGITVVRVNLALGEVHAKFPASASDPQKILGSIERMGFHAIFEEEVRIATGTSRESAELMTVSAK